MPTNNFLKSKNSIIKASHYKYKNDNMEGDTYILYKDQHEFTASSILEILQYLAITLWFTVLLCV